MKTKDVILEKTDRGLDIFKYYLNVSFTVGKNFRNPLYDDRKGSCNIFLDKRNNIYRMKDFGNEAYSGDPFWLVSHLTGMDLRSDFKTILEKISNDMGLNVVCPPNSYMISQSRIIPDSHSNDSSYSCIPRSFTSSDLLYWNQYGIDKLTLEKFDVRPLSIVTGCNRSGNVYIIESTPSEPIFGYFLTLGRTTYVKIYRPKSKIRFMYLGKKDEDYVFGYDKLPAMGHYLFITGGEKDVMSLSAHGFPAISLNSETARLPIKFYEDLKKRFTRIYILYDIDDTGIRESKRLAEEYGLSRIRLDLDKFEGKDISDYFKSYTRRDFLRIICDSEKNSPYDIEFPVYPLDTLIRRIKGWQSKTEKGLLPLFLRNEDELNTLLEEVFLEKQESCLLKRTVAFISVTYTYIDEICSFQPISIDIRYTSSLAINLLDFIDALLAGKSPPECIVIHDADFIDDTELPLKLRRVAAFYGILIICIGTVNEYKNLAIRRQYFLQSEKFYDLD